MSNLQHRQSIIQEKRKKTPWRDFVMEICSRYPFMFYKNKGVSSTISENNRVLSTNHQDYDKYRDQLLDGNYDNNLFPNLQKLLLQIGLPNTFHFTENENSEYSNCVLGSKNIYLSFTVIKDVENVLYGFSIKSGSKNCMNSFMIRDNSENVFNSKCIISSYNIFYSNFVKNSNNVWFSSNMIGCSECINCNGLKNQTYSINNIQYDKDRYFEMKSNILADKGSFQNITQNISLYGDNYGSVDAKNCNYVVESNDVENGQYLFEIQHSRNAILIGGNGKGEYVYDCFLNTPSISHIYGGLSLGTGTEHTYCSMHVVGGFNIYYSIYCQSCSFCLGCVGLKNKSYCILNKQYTKEERYEKVDEIFGAMHVDGVLGDFFPATMNPFYFNDTAAYLIDPSFTKEEVTAKGYLRRDEPIKVDIPAGVQTVSVKDLDKYEGWKPRSVIARNGAERNDEAISNTDYASLAMTQGNQIASSPSQGSKAPRNDVDSGGQQWYIDDEILKKVIIDEQGNAYRIIPMELEFLRKYELPLPRKHWLDRMKENFRIN